MKKYLFFCFRHSMTGWKLKILILKSPKKVSQFVDKTEIIFQKSYFVMTSKLISAIEEDLELHIDGSNNCTITKDVYLSQNEQVLVHVTSEKRKATFQHPSSEEITRMEDIKKTIEQLLLSPA